MHDHYGVKGRVRTLQQRKIKIWLLDSGIANCPNHDSFDVHFSPTQQVLLETEYTHSTYIYRHRRHEYDNAQRLSRTIESDASGMETRRFDFEYCDGKCLRTTRDGVGNILSRGASDYVDGSLISSSSYEPDGQPALLTAYEYQGGKVLKKVSKSFYRGKPGEVWTCHYDSLGRIVETYGLTAEGKPVGDGRYKYEYDEEGRERRILSYDDWSDSNVPNHVRAFRYKCDEQGNWIERIEGSRFRSDKKWKTYKTTRKLTYHPSGGV